MNATRDDDSQSLSNASPSTKRRRVTLACGHCRERKRKCDGVKPVCGECKKKRKSKIDCVYTDDNLKRGSSSYVDSLRVRIRELESLLETRLSHSDLSAPIPSGASRSGTASGDLDVHDTVPSALESQSESVGDQEDGSWAELDGMGPRGEAASTANNDSGQSSMTYFGPSSVFGFMKQLQHTRNELPDELQSFIVSIPVHKKGGHARLHDLIEKVPISLPPRAEADALVEAYFRGVHSLYPFLHRSTFEGRYSKIWESNSKNTTDHQPMPESDDRLFYSLLNALFALGVHFTSFLAPEERAEVSELYFSRAMGTLNFGMLAQGSLQLVQTLLLLSQYLQSTDMPGLCWNMVGLAIRVGQSIGLHIPRTSTTNQSKELMLLDELRRRIWGGCITFDRVMAMIYGRPLMISPKSTNDFIFPSLDDEELDHPETSLGNNSSSKSANINVYVHSLKLIFLLGDILESFYTGSLGVGGQSSEGIASVDRSRLRTLLDFDAALVNLQKSWPDDLQVGIGSASPFSSRQALTLRARFLHMRIFLLRPFMLALHRMHHAKQFHGLESSVEEMVAKSTLDQVTGTCVSATEELIDLIWGRTMDATDDLSFAWSWWYNVFYIYTCATVIHVGRLFHPFEPGRLNNDALSRSWQKCMQCLTKYEPFGVSARKARKELIRLEKQLNISRQADDQKKSDAVRLPEYSGIPQDNPSNSMPFQMSSSGEWDFLASWDSLQFDATFGLANDPLKWTGADFHFLGTDAFAPGSQQIFMP